MGYNKRWGRLDELNRLVEFTYDDPTGRFHSSIIWVEVDATTKPYSTVSPLGVIEPPIDPHDIKGEGFVEIDAIKGTDIDVVLHDAWKQAQEDLKKPESDFTAKVNQDYIDWLATKD